MLFMKDWRLKEVLKEAQITQEKLAELLDCSKGQVSMLLSGERKFHSVWITEISRVLNIPVWHLFVDPQTIATEETSDLVKRYQTAPDHIQKAIDDLLKVHEE
jgi:transcriptional regulator with XRE-family HTH domain